MIFCRKRDININVASSVHRIPQIYISSRMPIYNIYQPCITVYNQTMRWGSYSTRTMHCRARNEIQWTYIARIFPINEIQALVGTGVFIKQLVNDYPWEILTKLRFHLFGRNFQFMGRTIIFAWHGLQSGGWYREYQAIVENKFTGRGNQDKYQVIPPISEFVSFSTAGSYFHCKPKSKQTPKLQSQWFSPISKPLSPCSSLLVLDFPGISLTSASPNTSLKR